MIERYSTPEMRDIWSDGSRYDRWLKIEILAVEARALAGEVPMEDLGAIREKASFDPLRIEEIEKTVRHDVIAFLTSVSESLGPESRHIHYGMTSSDILDTCLATQIRDSGELIGRKLDELGRAVAGLVRRTRGIPCIGRSHGMFAEPTTIALKFAGYYSEYLRVRRRLDSGMESACVGKISGAVGTYAHLDPSVEAHICSKLGIGAESAATQVVPRDRHADFIYALASAGCLMDRLGTEIRHLQRSEVGEVEESFGRGQKGSSAMPHKRNPIVSERLCGMARMLRGFLVPALENTVLWHERDISHSSAERFLFPDACGITLYMLGRAVSLVEGLRLFPKRISGNLDSAGDGFHSQTLLLALIDAGLTREEAYSMVQGTAMRSLETGTDLAEAAAADGEISRHLASDVIRDGCTLDHHLRNEDDILDRLGLLEGDR